MSLKFSYNIIFKVILDTYLWLMWHLKIHLKNSFKNQH